MTGALPILRRTVTSLFALSLSLGEAGAQTKACDEIRTIKIHTTTLHYVECGKGEPLVFVHGGLGDLHTFKHQVQAFATDFRVIAYSRRFSPPNAPPLETDVSPLRMHIDDLRALMKGLNANPAHLVGASYGAYIALALALDHPDLVRSLVLGEPPIMSLLPRTSVGKDMQQSWFDRTIESSRNAFKGGDLEDGMRKFYEGICRRGPGCFDDLPQSRKQELVAEQARELRAQSMTERSLYLPPLECANLGRLTRPTLLVTGERSPAIFLLITAELERCLEGESQVMVPEAGHGMHAQNAAFYNKAVATFLRRHQRLAQALAGVGEGWPGEFDHAARQLTQLAEAIPPEKYSWRPAPGVRSIAEVYMHLALSNYSLLARSGLKPQTQVDIAKMGEEPEKSITAKAEVIAFLKASLDVLRATAATADRSQKVKLFGKEVTVDGVLLRLLVHNNEHMGQLIAYARLNGVTPPWSRGDGTQ